MPRINKNIVCTPAKMINTLADKLHGVGFKVLNVGK